MKIDNILLRDNELMEQGKIDEQIILDLKNYINVRKKYQEYLDKGIGQSLGHYNEWKSANDKKIKYVERILKCVEIANKL